VYLPAIDATQLQIRNGNLDVRKGSTRPLPASDHAIHCTPPSRITQKIGAPPAGLFPGSVSTLQITVSPPLKLHIAKITTQKFEAADRRRHQSSYRLPPKSRKRHYELETCARCLDKDTHLIGTYLGANLILNSLASTRSRHKIMPHNQSRVFSISQLKKRLSVGN
jgi:hypothetical protein